MMSNKRKKMAVLLLAALALETEENENRRRPIRKKVLLPMGPPRRKIQETSGQNAVGYKAWCQEYSNQIVDPKELQQRVDSFMADFEKREAEENAAKRRRTGAPDEDGWITVTRTGRQKGAPRTEAAALRAIEKKGKKASATLSNFYVFQKREAKMKNVVDLRRKFEEDKKQIAGLRARKKFKPE